LTYLRGKSLVVYQSRKGKKTKTFDALEWIAAICSHVPKRGEQMVRYYGYYSNVCRGRRKKEDQDETVPHIIEDSITSTARRKSWARLIQKIYEVDPLICPKCAGSMKIIAFIEQAEVIKKILQHVGLWEQKRNPLPRAGPQQGQICIDYTESQAVYTDDDCDPDYPFEAYL
jgi:hypothetical protein